ncbi:MAG: tetratricopeptide repeat protein [Elusimicrobiaceae bacterium]
MRRLLANDKITRCAPYAALAAAVAAVFWPCLRADYFNWDDYQIFVGNSQTQNLSWSGIKTVFQSFVVGHYQPLTTLSFILERAVFGTNPPVSHLINILLHFINSVLVFELVKIIVSDRRKAFLAALLFSIHPMHVESVAWVAERKDVLYSVFYLAALTLYARYCAAEKIPARGRLAALALVSGLFVCALLAKAMAMTLPFALLFLDYLGEKKLTLRRILEKVPFAALAFIFALLAVHTQGKSGYIAAFSLQKLTGGICIASGNMLFYFWKFVTPVRLSVFYPYPGNGVYSVPAHYYPAPFILAAALFLLWHFGRKATPLAGWGIAFFTVTIFPCLQLVPVGFSLAAEHYTYLPYLGLLIPLADAFWRQSDKLSGRGKQIMAFCCAFYLLALGGGAMARCFSWRDSVALWSGVLARYPSCTIALNNRGLAYSNSGRYALAVRDFAAAIKLDPKSAMFHSNMAASLAKNGDTAAALESARAAVELDPNNADALVNYGNLCLFKGEKEAARAAYHKALQISPAHTTAIHNLKQL